jgi:PAS domain S-box-containing protein
MTGLLMKKAKKIQSEKHQTNSHDAMILKLGELGLHAEDIQNVMNEAVTVIAATFEVQYCEILELLSDGMSLLFRAQTGKREGLASQTVVEAESDTQEGYALQHHEIVILQNLAIETRFRKSAVQREKKVVSGITVIIHKNGTPFGILQIYTTKRRKFTEEEAHLLQFSANILSETIKRKELEEALRMSEEKYSCLFEESKDVVFFSTVEGELIDINPAGVQLFGFSSKDEMLRMNIEQDLYVDATDREEYHRILFENGYVKNFELALKTKNGHILFVQETATAVRDGKGNVIAYRGIMRDITNVKLLQQELMQARKLELLGKLASGVAHDFNHLLTTIAGFCGAMDLLLHGADPAREYLQKIDETIQKGSLLTWKLLAFGKER